MKTLDFVNIELSARQLHDEEVRRSFGRIAHALSKALHHFLHALHPSHPQGGPKRFA